MNLQQILENVEFFSIDDGREHGEGDPIAQERRGNATEDEHHRCEHLDIKASSAVFKEKYGVVHELEEGHAKNEVHVACHGSHSSDYQYHQRRRYTADTT